MDKLIQLLKLFMPQDFSQAVFTVAIAAGMFVGLYLKNEAISAGCFGAMAGYLKAKSELKERTNEKDIDSGASDAR